jgi:hypothetical protein
MNVVQGNPFRLTPSKDEHSPGAPRWLTVLAGSTSPTARKPHTKLVTPPVSSELTGFRIANLHAAGPVHKTSDGFTFATRAANRHHEIAE